ncbi:Ltp family lipoprotein [Prescottella sp. R16]|uniref:Ltp family lipoprotein n=1 Tax=Prescottella sp. R16 TaxID=3064529 RepID=UPI00351D8A47
MNENKWSATPMAPMAADPQLSSGQRNAVWSAQQYLESAAFSRSGLIGQLEYDGFSTAEATYGVDSWIVDWNEQATLSARQYLGTMPFSQRGLIEQLQYDGFTSAQAQYGVNAAY